MRYILHKKTEISTRGCPDDESETSSRKNYFFLVKETEEDEFGEYIADECGSQDYNWQCDFKKIGTFWLEDLIEIKKQIEKVINDD